MAFDKVVNPVLADRELSITRSVLRKKNISYSLL